MPPGGGERIWIVGDTLEIKATAADTGGAFTLIEALAAPGGGPPPHVHEREEETFHVLEGEFDLTVAGETVRGRPGTVLLVPRGAVHRWRCAGRRPGRLLILFSPGGLEGFFREAGRPATGDAPPPPVDNAEIARTEAAGRRHGLRVVEWAP